jgi:bacterioferritin
LRRYENIRKTFIFYRTRHISMAVKPTDEFLNLLNQAVGRELQVSVQYMLQHTKMEKIKKRVIAENILLEKNMYDAVGEILKKFAIEEMKHAGMIMERIYYLGGEATTKAPKPKVGDYISHFAEYGYDAEKEALEMYRKIVKMAEDLGDYETAEMFRVIYRQEEAHLLKFEEYLNFAPDGKGEELEDPAWIKTLKPEYFELLNKALAGEMSAIIQYTNQHEKVSLKSLRRKGVPLEAITSSNKGAVVSELLKKVFMQEMEHYEKIAERIYMLKQECGVLPDPLPEVGKTVEDFLKLDRKAEDDAIVLYRKIVDEATKCGDITTKKLFEQILMEEEQHFWSFDEFF